MTTEHKPNSYEPYFLLEIPSNLPWRASCWLCSWTLRGGKGISSDGAYNILNGSLSTGFSIILTFMN